MNSRSQTVGLTLLEILVSLVVFTLIVAIAGSVFYRVFSDWSKQKNYLRAIEEAQWALEFMSNEIRFASKSGIAFPNSKGGGWKVGQRKGLKFDIIIPAKATITYEWDGDNTLVRKLSGNQAVLLRNGFPTEDGIMYLPKLGNVPPPLKNAAIFYNVDPGTKLTTITVTIRPNANQAAGPGNKEYTVRTVIFPRNP